MANRIFAYVRQALFAVERVGDHIVVFDCGGEQEFDVVQAIDRILDEGEIIDILFVSHYDKDHINGIKYLLRLHQVRHLILPMVEESVRFRDLMRVPEDTFEWKFIIDPSVAIREFPSQNRIDIKPSIHYVAQWDDEERLEEVNHPIIVDINSVSDGQVIPARKAIVFDDFKDWIYLPYNRKIMNDVEWTNFLKRLNLPADSTVNDVLVQWEWLFRGRKNCIKDAWSSATGIPIRFINEYSMTLYSGPMGRNIGDGCLYTGDYNANAYGYELRRFYAKWDSNIHVVQIPHHGSWHNFSDEVIFNGAIHVISNKEHKRKTSDVDYTRVANVLKRDSQQVYETWDWPSELPL